MDEGSPYVWALVYVDGLEGFHVVGVFRSRAAALAAIEEHRGEGELRRGECYELSKLELDHAADEDDEPEVVA